MIPHLVHTQLHKTILAMKKGGGGGAGHHWTWVAWMLALLLLFVCVCVVADILQCNGRPLRSGRAVCHLSAQGHGAFLCLSAERCSGGQNI